jgi:predicted transcriptional regulator
MRPIALTPAQQRRLEKLAGEARRSARAMLKFVLRDGFEACEEDVRESRAADAEIAARSAVTHADAMARARAAIAPHARGSRKAA